MNSKLANQVMDRVVKYEQRHLRRWWCVFGVIMGTLIVVLGTTIVTIIEELREKETLSIFGIVTEDQAKLSQVWRDIVGVIWEDLSHYKVYIVAGVILAGVALLIVTAHRRRQLGRINKDIHQLKSENKNQAP